MRSRVAVRSTVVALLAVVTAACAGPRSPIDVSSKEVPIDLALGAAKRVAEAPAPPLLMSVPDSAPFAFPRRGNNPGGEFEMPDLPKPPNHFCPEYPPLAVPEPVAGTAPTKAPKVAEYPYRTKGFVQSVGPETLLIPISHPLSPISQVNIENVQPEPGDGYRYDFAVTNKFVKKTTSTYRVFSQGVQLEDRPDSVPTFDDPVPIPDETPRPGGVPDGIYLAEVRTEGERAPFRPAFPGILVARFPMAVGVGIDASGTDGATTMSWRSYVRGKETLNACGTPVDTYIVELTDGRIVDGERTERLEFTTRINLGTQYGAVPIAMTTTVKGVAYNDIEIVREVSMTADKEPNLP